jgi:O-methyltransferase
MGRSVNRVLRELTGYEIRRSRPARQPRAAAPRPTAKKPAAAPVMAGPAEIKFPLDYDDISKAIIREVRPRTMTSVEKLNALIYAVRYVIQHNIPGDIVECGVWRGGSMMAIARTLQSLDADRPLHLYDTYEGMTEPTEHDKRYDGRSAAEMLAATNRNSAIWAYASLEDVQDGMRSTTYPERLVHYYKGPVEETIPEHAPDQISILRLDTDWYESTRHELEHLYPRLVPGGVLLLDDYGWWEGARRAVEEFLADTKIPMLLLRMDEGRIALKPAQGWRPAD